MADTIDPLAGSYYVESLTTEIEQRAAAYLERIRKTGGMLRAIESGYVQREIGEAAYRDQQDIEAGRRVVVGVNRFQARRRSAGRDPPGRSRHRGSAAGPAPTRARRAGCARAWPRRSRGSRTSRAAMKT